MFLCVPNRASKAKVECEVVQRSEPAASSAAHSFKLPKVQDDGKGSIQRLRPARPNQSARNLAACCYTGEDPGEAVFDSSMVMSFGSAEKSNGLEEGPQNQIDIMQFQMPDAEKLDRLGGSDSTKTGVRQDCPVDGLLRLEERKEVELPSGCKYKGQWLSNVQSGIGVLMSPDGTEYRGDFADGKATGCGRLTLPNGECYEGEFSQGKASGSGTYTWRDGCIYKGEWRNDERTGDGLLRWSNGEVFEGQFQQGAKHGKGKLLAKSGRAVYKGDYRHDKMHGEGTYEFKNGRSYAGQWKHDLIDGQGVMKWPDGSMYEGSFKDDLRHGVGTLVWPDGRYYTGQWVCGKRKGTGIVVDAQGVKKDWYGNGEDKNV